MARINIFVFDERISDYEHLEVGFQVPASPYITFKMMVASGSGMANVVTRILSFKRSTDVIHTLYLVAHGDCGLVMLGDGISINSLNFWKGLNGAFDSSSNGIEIHACGVASDTSVYLSDERTKPGTEPSENGVGYVFLKALADTTGTRVQAAINPQKIDRDYHFEGPTITCYPSGMTNYFEDADALPV
jgi:hypothetical protein